MINQIYRFLLIRYESNNQEQRAKATIILNAALLTALFSIAYAFLYGFEGFALGAELMFGVAALFLSTALWLRLGLSLFWTGNYFVFTCWIPACLLIYLTGGVQSGVLPWLTIIPLTANLLINQKTAFIWLIISTLTGGAFGLWEGLGNDIPVQFPPQFEIFNLTLSVIGLSAITLLIVSIFDRAVKQAQSALKTQHDKILFINQDLQEKNQEIITQNEELHQQQEEIITQRDYIEQKNQELEQTNRKIQANESILKKALSRLQESEEKIKRQNQSLAERDRIVSSSLNAAKTIQHAILPYQDKLNHLLRDYFILYQPKDVVSGDFFWLNQVDNQNILIVADCTGHGVPGAFMTLIGNTLLDKIIRVWQILSPAQILSKLHEEVRTVLRQSETGNNNGMDMAVINWQTMPDQSIQLTYCGAKLPIYYIESGQSQVLQLNPDRKAIGGIQNENTIFQNQTIQIASGSHIYMGSDGYIDQNNQKRARLGEKKFKEVLQEVYQLPLPEQQKTLENVLQEQMQNTTQRDDILLLGFQVIA
ncbi:MAG: SpoIIE family protein phosphatase [Microscillaceae bacterium]|jgi:serine phosphatase RsbU (regulator of sigma subunit)|nr:SpoIIE family protein phosphatase [Microscillaceae bacterium]